MPCITRLLLRKTDTGDLGVGERRGGNRLVVHLLVVPGDDTGRHEPLMRGDVRQLDLAYDVANGEHLFDVGAHAVVDRDIATLVRLHAGLLEIQVDRVGTPRHADEHVVGFDCLLVLAVIIRNGDPQRPAALFGALLDFGDGGAGQDLDAAPLE